MQLRIKKDVKTINQAQIYEKHLQQLLKQLLSEIQRKIKNNSGYTSEVDFHIFPVSIIKKIIQRQLNKDEEKIWIKYRNEQIRLREQRNHTKKNTNNFFEERKEFNLIGLSNSTLCTKLVELELAHTEPIFDKIKGWISKKNRAATNQVVRALALHSLEEIQQLVQQIKSFTHQQKTEAAGAIEIINATLESLKMKNRQAQTLLELSHNDLLTELTSYFEENGTHWPEKTERLLTGQLRKIPEINNLKKLLAIIQKIQLSTHFTSQMKSELISITTNYITLRTHELEEEAKVKNILNSFIQQLTKKLPSQHTNFTKTYFNDIRTQCTQKQLEKLQYLIRNAENTRLTREVKNAALDCLHTNRITPKAATQENADFEQSKHGLPYNFIITYSGNETPPNGTEIGYVDESKFFPEYIIVKNKAGRETRIPTPKKILIWQNGVIKVQSN